MIKRISPIILFLVMLQVLTGIALAQTTALGVAVSMPVEDEDITEGDILCTGEVKLKKCNSEIDSSIFGVAVKEPAIEINNSVLEGERLVVTSGRANVKVSMDNGPINEGDYITISEIPGVGVRTEKSGNVLGVALSAHDSTDIGDTEVAIDIHYVTGLSSAKTNLIEVLRRGISAPIFEPLTSLRYVLAAILIITSFTLGFVYFGRISKTGVEALGRNPLAKGTIQRNITLHIIVTIIIILIGFGGAYLVLIL